MERNIVDVRHELRGAMEEYPPMFRPGAWVVMSTCAFHVNLFAGRFPQRNEAVSRNRRISDVARYFAKMFLRGHRFLWHATDDHDAQVPTCSYVHYGYRYFVVFDHDLRHIYRIFDREADLAREESVRKQLADHFDIPHWEVVPQTNILKEEFISGGRMGGLDKATRSDLFKKLIGNYTSFAAHARAVGGLRPVGDLSSLTDMLNGGENLLYRWAHGKLREISTAFSAANLCMLSHSDMTATNIIVSDNKPVLIDFEMASPNIFYGDVLWLAVDEAARSRADLLWQYLRGGFDAEMAELFRAAGHRFEPEKRLTYASAAVLYRTNIRISRFKSKNYKRDNIERKLMTLKMAFDR